MLLAGALSAEAKAEDRSMLPWFLRVNYPLTPAQREEAARELIERGSWLEWSRALGEALTRDYKSGQVDQKPWIARLRWAQMCRDLARPEMQEALQQDANSFVALLAQEELMQLLGATLSPQDNIAGVWRVLRDLSSRHPQEVHDYPALAVTLAVVFDREFPEDWPHRQVKASLVPRVSDNAREVMMYFVEQDRAGKLLWPLAALRVDQLKYLVDVPIDISELRTMRAKLKITRPNLDKLFSMVDYDLERLRADELDWIGDDYKLSTIFRKGGICVDQAYFAAMSGKALGVPTLYFSGQGTGGGHAWFGFLKEENKWMLEAGRYEEQQYVTGRARDPQTWEPINDHQLRFLSSGTDSQTIYHYSRNIVALARLEPNASQPEKQAEIFAEALRVNPQLPMIWEAVEEGLIAAGSLDALRRHYEKMVEQFATQDDVKAVALRKLWVLALKTGDSALAQSCADQLLNLRSDLAIQWAAEGVRAQLRLKQYAAAAQSVQGYLSSFTKAGREPGGGNLYFELVAPTVLALKKQQQDALAEATLRFAVPFFARDPLSLVQKHLAALQEVVAKK